MLNKVIANRFKSNLITRLPAIISPTSERVIVKFISYGDEMRQKSLISEILNKTSKEVNQSLIDIINKYAYRHENYLNILNANYEKVKPLVEGVINDGKTSYKHIYQIPANLMYLIGAFFTTEYSIEAAALFNPSIVPHPVQNNLNDGELRVIISLRAVGEGHVSSIEFREAIINEKGDINIHPFNKFVSTPTKLSFMYNKEEFFEKIQKIFVSNNLENQFNFIREQLKDLPNEFSHDQVAELISSLLNKNDLTENQTISLRTVIGYSNSNYILKFDSKIPMAQKVIFPNTESESRGIEDARFVCIDGTYYASYTAYNGFTISPQLIETKDFEEFKITTLTGNGAQNKGMAIFPEKINGKYAMISRNDGEHMFIMFSDDIQHWENPQMIETPKQMWELIQLGNCGSPIKTDKGWLLLTHGVGPMREYAIGAMLLDLDDPSKVIASLKNPLLSPNESEREGYVPNVVYTCGVIKHEDNLIIPYAKSDTSTKFAKVDINDLLEKMHK